MPISKAVVQPGSLQEAKVVAKPMREPIRVGGNVQESKLIYKVEPVYPELAKRSRVSGVVILQVNTNEAGEVYEVRVLRGHPMLDEAAIDAVKQWKYSATYLNGEPVPIIATVTVIFNLGAGRSVMLDQAGNLRDPVSQLEGSALIQKMKESRDTFIIQPSAGVPMRVIEETLRALQREGIQNLRVSGFVDRDGRLFASVGAGGSTPINQAAVATGSAAPVIALDNELLASIAKSSGLVDNLPLREKPLIYRIFMNEVGEIVGIEQMRGPKIPALENELMRTRVVSPGRRGADPIPVVFYAEVSVP